MNAATGAVALTGTAAGNTCTVVATSSLDGATPGVKASATRAVAITKLTVAASATSCSPGAPRAGDVITQSVAAQNNVFKPPDDSNGATKAPNNPIIRVVPTVTANYNYVANGTGTKLTTTATGGVGTEVAGRWDGFVPIPVPAALPNKHVPNVVTELTFDASGNLTTPTYWQPAKTGRYGLNDIFTGIVDQYPINWREQFAAQVTGSTAVNAVIGTGIPVTLSVHGGWLNAKAFVKSNAGVTGASYQNVYYTATAKYLGRSSAPADIVTTANGKLEYTNLCKIEYTLTRKAKNGAVPEGITFPNGPAGPIDPQTPTAAVNSAYVNYVWTADIIAKTTFGGPNAAGTVRNGTDSFGDKKSVALFHTSLPRMTKENYEALPTVAGGAAVTGGGTTAQGNAEYYQAVNNTVTIITKQDTTTTGVTRTQLP